MLRRPVPASLRIRDLDDRERLNVICPGCGKMIGYQCYSVKLEQPGDMLVLRYVARHVCSRCGVRARGELETFPRSGAEGGDGPSKA
jgi:hypothetical protein